MILSVTVVDGASLRTTFNIQEAASEEEDVLANFLQSASSLLSSTKEGLTVKRVQADGCHSFYMSTEASVSIVVHCTTPNFHPRDMEVVAQQMKGLLSFLFGPMGTWSRFIPDIGVRDLVVKYLKRMERHAGIFFGCPEHALVPPAATVFFKNFFSSMDVDDLIEAYVVIGDGTVIQSTATPSSTLYTLACVDSRLAADMAMTSLPVYADVGNDTAWHTLVLLRAGSYVLALFFDIQVGADEFVPLVENIEAVVTSPMSKPEDGWYSFANTSIPAIESAEEVFDPITSWAVLVPHDGVCVSSLPTSPSDPLDDRGTETLRWACSRVLDMFLPLEKSPADASGAAEEEGDRKLLEGVARAVPTTGCILIKDENPFYVLRFSIRNGRAHCLVVVVGKSDATTSEVKEVANRLTVSVCEQL
uniref:Uncharacterized protein n=1 Tax=Palpitomonas bilix TaxID=652834 RepID=A0A7S3G665_9EUKA|mmetsp:Transcript_32767/g.84636  ORF Transcript_32767/g.84636 Transcript_32767/m.84636 type:complete len:418 (+) Transcript_32767:333-1586(+)|eukprot:CAMPEP_0113892472 /NCGR_PEP_ID=MMETSP0780_2-20120614/15440_1 /TAXON_ID=652834 /ORGANISM="Palpitomonas bilix" /LENGTH=417 /DNA_ID=CAMNT_0000882423 /DNA_START=310 /DNA_END=1563 /DNA_ORIENTATION=- /assembly_acc=CAM_ASM_000599